MGVIKPSIRPNLGGLEFVQAHGNMGATETIDLGAGNVHTGTLDANCTLTFSGGISGLAQGFTLVLTQDGTGSRTVTWPGSVSWPGASTPTLATAAGSVDEFVFASEDGGTAWRGHHITRTLPASPGPGYEYDYVSKTSNTSITATSAGTANTIVTANAKSYDGATTIMLEFFCAFLDASTDLLIAFFDGSTQVDVFGAPQNSVRNQGGVLGSLRLTPSNASHTYSVRAWVASGTSTIYGGTGSGGGIPPAYIRQTKV
jgi:hypothetical protein